MVVLNIPLILRSFRTSFKILYSYYINELTIVSHLTQSPQEVQKCIDKLAPMKVIVALNNISSYLFERLSLRSTYYLAPLNKRK